MVTVPQYLEETGSQNWRWPNGLVRALFKQQRHYKQNYACRKHHCYFCWKDRFSICEYLWR